MNWFKRSILTCLLVLMLFAVFVPSRPAYASPYDDQESITGNGDIYISQSGRRAGIGSLECSVFGGPLLRSADVSITLGPLQRRFLFVKANAYVPGLTTDLKLSGFPSDGRQNFYLKVSQPFFIPADGKERFAALFGGIMFNRNQGYTQFTTRQGKEPVTALCPQNKNADREIIFLPLPNGVKVPVPVYIRIR